MKYRSDFSSTHLANKTHLDLSTSASDADADAAANNQVKRLELIRLSVNFSQAQNIIANFDCHHLSNRPTSQLARENEGITKHISQVRRGEAEAKQGKAVDVMEESKTTMIDKNEN